MWAMTLEFDAAIRLKRCFIVYAVIRNMTVSDIVLVLLMTGKVLQLIMVPDPNSVVASPPNKPISMIGPTASPSPNVTE
jgi:hypothetical protein